MKILHLSLRSIHFWQFFVISWSQVDSKLIHIIKMTTGWVKPLDCIALITTKWICFEFMVRRPEIMESSQIENLNISLSISKISNRKKHFSWNMFIEKLKIIFIFCSYVLCNDVHINIDIDDEQTEPVKDPQPFLLNLPFR